MRQLATTFAMITTKPSSAYTKVALDSFFKHTQLESNDRFFLIDNDQSFLVDRKFAANLTLLANDFPKSFAANVNQVMEIARHQESDLFLLNNDLVFAPGWIEPFKRDDLLLLCAVSNREFQYSTENLQCARALSLEDYLGHEREFLQIAKAHRNSRQGLLPVLTLPFFCVKIPFQIYRTVGPLDESFGLGGGEDGDYCLRLALAGFKAAYLLESYLLHFNGRSTWAVESKQEELARCSRFRQRFVEKWGQDLSALILGYDMKVLEKYGGFADELQSADFKTIIEKIIQADGTPKSFQAATPEI